MDEIKVYYDRTGETLTVWFGNTKDEHVCEMTREEVILMTGKEMLLALRRCMFLRLHLTR